MESEKLDLKVVKRAFSFLCKANCFVSSPVNRDNLRLKLLSSPPSSKLFSSQCRAPLNLLRYYEELINYFYILLASVLLTPRVSASPPYSVVFAMHFTTTSYKKFFHRSLYASVTTEQLKLYIVGTANKRVFMLRAELAGNLIKTLRNDVETFSSMPELSRFNVDDGACGDFNWNERFEIHSAAIRDLSRAPGRVVKMFYVVNERRK